MPTENAVVGNKVIDSSTGEIITEHGNITDVVIKDRYDKIMDIIKNTGAVPYHVQRAKELSIPIHTMTSYIGTPSLSVKDVIGRKVNLIGAIVYQSGRFTPKDPSKTDGSGFTAIILKTDEFKTVEFRDGKTVKEIRKPITIKTDGKKIVEVLLGLMESYGEFDWNGVKVPVVFSFDSSANAFGIDVLPLEENDTPEEE